MVKEVREYPAEPGVGRRPAKPRTFKWGYRRAQPKYQYYRRYTRTYRLYKGWRVYPRRGSAALYTYVVNVVPYSRWVHGEEQVWWHTRTGWRRLIEHLRRDKYRRMIQAVYDRHATKGT